MNQIDLEEDGFVEVKIGDIVEVVDVYEWHSFIASLTTSDDAKTSSIEAKIVEKMRPKFGEVSNRVAIRFAESIIAEVETLKKKDESVESVSANAN